MNNKGSIIIELLAVVIFIGIIVAIAFTLKSIPNLNI